MNICVSDDRWYIALVIVIIPSFFLFHGLYSNITKHRIFNMITMTVANCGSELITESPRFLVKFALLKFWFSFLCSIFQQLFVFFVFCLFLDL